MLSKDDRDRLLAYCHNFFGYGNPRAPFWFVGLEEGGGNSVNETIGRVNAWEEQGRPVLADLLEFHRSIGVEKWFGPDAVRQKTWGMLVRSVLLANGIQATANTVLHYQAEKLARRKGETALLELMPLPSRRTSDWIYSKIGIQSLESRKEYIAALQQERIRSLTDLIVAEAPASVVFYGGRRAWPGLLGVVPAYGEDFDVAAQGKSRLIFTNHPTAFGARNSQFDSVGRAMRESS